MFSQNAYAKVNLSLLITGINDNGYHILDTVMQTVSLYDTVTVCKNNENIIDVLCDNNELSGENNICYKAAQLFYKTVHVQSGVTIKIIKKIPQAAGLGGGSADAAAVLNLMNRLYNYPLSYSELCDIALELGADVPFCIKGGSARVGGIGEDLEYIKRTLPLYLVLVKDMEKPSTGYMYKEFDRIGKFSINSQRSEQMVKGLESGDYREFVNAFYNDFSSVWDYTDLKEQLVKIGADGVSLSGSGPTVMGVFSSKEKADKAADILLQKYSNVFSVTAVGE